MSRERTFAKLTAGLLAGFLLVQAGLAQDQDPARSLRGTLQLEDIVEYRALPEYREAPELAALVEAGELPPIEERLPREPRIMKRAQMVDGPGVHGGVWRDTFAVPTVSWNWGAGQTQGWFGVNEMVQEALVDLFPMWMMEEPEPAPRLARSWEWSEDGHELTMYLIEGARWSDGEPFTADDVLFTFEHYIMDPSVPSWTGPTAWEYGGEPTRLEKIDAYTIRFHFGAPFPIAAFYRMGYLQFSVMPEHVFSHYHPAFNEEMNYTDLLTAAPPQDLPPVTLGAFVPVIYQPGEQMILVRNPYYWQVDEDGNQLPYHSEVWYAEAASGTQRTFNLIADRGDRDNVENPQIFGMMFEGSQAPDSHFDLRFEDFRIVYRMIMNFAEEFGADSDRARALREMFRTLEFRQALSHAIDRDGLATAAFPGPLTQAWYGGYPSGSPFYDEDLVNREAQRYDPARSRELLAELGFQDTDGDGIVNWPEGTLVAGQNLIIEVLTGEDQQAAVEAGQALVSLFREVGIDLRLRVMTGPTVTNRVDTGNFDIVIHRIDTPTPDVQMGTYGPASADEPAWHQSGPGGRELLPFEQRMEELLIEAQFEPDAERRAEIFHEILQLHTDNIYTLGLYEARAGLAVHRRLRNIPDDLPTFMYEWGMENMPWVAWTATEEQIAPRFLDRIPTAAAYQNRAWQR
jgi:peptide/nickel transport system substrate-binding protein